MLYEYDVFGVTMSWIVTADVIDSTNYHAKHSCRWRCITCVQNWHVKDYAHISISVPTWLRAK